MKNLITVFFITLSFTIFSQENIDLFIWAGQSNAMGFQGDAAQYPADPNNLDNDIRFNYTVANGANSGGWTIMQPQVGRFPDGHFGPEVTFSRKLVQAGYNPAIFKYTQGGTSIFEHWRGPGEGGLYDNMVAALNTAITQLENQGHTVNVRGFIWIQGESDSKTDASASAYFNNLTTLLNDVRNTVINDAELPIILGVDEQFFNITGFNRHQILNAHQDIALNDEHIKFTSMYGYPKADATHLTPAGLISHGEDLFDSYQLLVSGNKPLESCTLSSSGADVSFERASWGQSFNTDCSGNVSSITFSAASIPEGTVTFTLHNGADCSGTVLMTKSLDFMTVGDNIVEMPNNLYLDKEHTYYLNIVSDLNELWQINYTKTGNATGMLRTFSEGSNCGRSFPSFDMNFSVEITGSEPEGCTLSSSGSEVSFERASWGQSFEMDCTGNLSTITFSSASVHDGSATFILYDGSDCNSTVLFTKSLNSIVSGDNVVDITGVNLASNYTYYFNIVSDAGSFWKIHYSNTSTVEGRLTTFKNGSDCGREFPNFDMDFSVAVESNGNLGCPDPAFFYSFNYDGKNYEVVKEGRTWVKAAACADQRGGYLVEINDQAEQDAIYAELQNANISLANTVAINGGGASYVWIGANDRDEEGRWVWDGDNKGSSIHFWQGGVDGNPVNGLYSNWGTEPDNAKDKQHAGAMAITQWPVNSGSLGVAGQWNDINEINTMYYVIEYAPTGVQFPDLSGIGIYPNPVKSTFTIDSKGKISSLKIYSVTGVQVKSISQLNGVTPIDVSDLQSGLYILELETENGLELFKLVVE